MTSINPNIPADPEAKPESFQPAKLIPAPAMGIHLDMPANIYHQTEGCSSSFMSEMLEFSPFHAHWGRLHPSEPTDATELGEAVHLAILQPDLFAKRYVVPEQCAGITGKGERCVNNGKGLAGGRWWCGVHAKGKTFDVLDLQILSADNFAKCQATSRACYDHPFLRKLLKNPEPVESSIWWKDPETGVVCKARRDKLGLKFGIILDLKTCECANVKEFEKSVWNYGYHRQSAHYLNGSQAIGEEVKLFLFAAIEKNPPYGVQLFAMKPECVELGKAQVQSLVNDYAECEQAGEWPSYSTKTQAISIPAWAERSLRRELEIQEIIE